MRASWIWWFQPVRDVIRFQIQRPDGQWGYDHLNRYSQSPMIRSSISSLDLLTLLHCIWWKCNRSILAGWLVQIPAPQRGGGVFLMHHMQIRLAFVFWTWRQSRGDVRSLTLSLKHEGPSDPCVSAALSTPCSGMHVCILWALQNNNNKQTKKSTHTEHCWKNS